MQELKTSVPWLHAPVFWNNLQNGEKTLFFLISYMKKPQQHWFINKQNCVNSYYKVRKVFSSFTTVNKHHMYQKRRTLAKRATPVAPSCFCFILSELQLALSASTKQYKLWHCLTSLKWTQPLAPAKPWTRTYINIPTHSAVSVPVKRAVAITWWLQWPLPLGPPDKSQASKQIAGKIHSWVVHGSLKSVNGNLYWSLFRGGDVEASSWRGN